MESNSKVETAEQSQVAKFHCQSCDLFFTKQMTLYQHRRREHTTELYFMLNEDVTISVLKCLGKFRCPLVNCLKSYTNITTFTKHAKRDHGANVTVSVNDNDSDDLNAMNCLKRKGMTMDCDSFSLIDGTQNALKLVSKRKAFHTAGLLDCEPLALHLSHSSMADPYKVYGLFHANDVSDIYNKVPFESSSISTSLNCTIQLHTEDHNIQPTNISESNDTLHYLKQTVRASTLPGLLQKNDFLEPTQEILEHLNFDFRLDPALLYAVAKLHTGALIIDKEVVFCLAAEAYGRSKAVDIHGEANLKSLPSPSNSVYKSLSVGVHEESDGNGSKLKLKIGSSTMNVLITMSVLLRAETSVDIGPEISATTYHIQPATARIFYRNDEITRFLDAMRSLGTYTVPKSITSLRQLVSGFGHPSTFLHARAVHEEFNADLMLPATIFTVCDTPHNQGYGASAVSVGKLASQFLQSLALSVILNLPAADFTTALDSFKRAAAIRQLQTNGQAASKFSKSWNTLASFVDKLELVQKQDIPPLVLGTYLDFSSLAILAGITASASNQRIKEDVWNHLRRLYSY